MPSTHQMIISAILSAFAPMAAAQEVDGPVPTPLQILLCPETDPLCDPLDTADPGKGPVRAFLQNPESWDFHRGLLVIHPF